MVPNDDTTRSLVAGHDGLATNLDSTSHTGLSSSNINTTLPKIDPLDGLLLGNTTAFDTEQQEHHTHISPSHQQAATMSSSTRMNDLFQQNEDVGKDTSKLRITSKYLLSFVF